MKFANDKNYYREYKDNLNNKPFKYRLTYCGNCIYQLTKNKYKVVYQCYSFRSMYNFIKKKNICLNEIHLPYMTLNDFLRDWVTFDEERDRV